MISHTIHTIHHSRPQFHLRININNNTNPILTFRSTHPTTSTLISISSIHSESRYRYYYPTTNERVHINVPSHSYYRMISLRDPTILQDRPNQPFSSYWFSTTSTNITSLKQQQQQQQQERISFPRNSKLFQRVDQIIATPLGQLHPLDIKYTSVHILRDCCKLQSKDGMEKAMLLLSRLLQEKKFCFQKQQDQNPMQQERQNTIQRAITVVPRFTFQMVLYGWAQVAKQYPFALPKANDIVQIMWEEYAWDQQYIYVNSSSSLSNPTSVTAPSSTPSTTPTSSCRPNVHVYNTLLAAHAYGSKFHPQTIPKRAEDILRNMYQRSQTYPDVSPNTNSYNLVLQCYANSGTATAGDEAFRLLQEMMMNTTNTSSSSSSSSLPASSSSSSSPHNMEEILHPIPKRPNPNLYSYTHVIHAYANNPTSSQDSCQKAEEILLHLIQRNSIHDRNSLYKKELPSKHSAMVGGPKTNDDEFKEEDTNIIHPWDPIDTEEEEEFKLDPVLFTSCIQAWVNAAKNYTTSPKARVEAAQRAQDIMNMMYDLAMEWEKDQEISQGQDGKIHETAATDQQCEETPTRINPYLPTVVTWNTVLLGWAKSDTKEAAPRAQQLLNEMIQSAMRDWTEHETVKSNLSTGDFPNKGRNRLLELGITIVPNAISFHTVMDAWARYGKFDPLSAQRAQDMLSIMYDMYHSGRFPESSKPCARTYAIAMNAWARSQGNDPAKENPSLSSDTDNKLKRCRTLLDQMLSKYKAGEEDMKPNIVAYTTVLNAAAHSPSNATSSEVLRIADDTYEEILDSSDHSGLVPDDLVFAIMLQIVKKHTDKRSEYRRVKVERIFDDACRLGQVSSKVLKELKSACPSVDLLQRLIGKRTSIDKIDFTSDLPKPWTKNVRVQASMRHR